MLKRLLNTVALATLLAAPAVAQDGPEVVMEWDSLPYSVKDQATLKAWVDSEIFGKALMQGAKVDADGNFYVSTARWGGAEVPSTLSKLVQNGDTWELEAFPSEAMNAVDNPDGLKAVLGFEIDRNGVMWILDQGHIAGAPNKEGDAKLILWDLAKNEEIQRYVFTAEEADPTCSFLNDIAIDNDTGFAYIADSGIFCDPLEGGLIVYDSNTNSVRRILDQHRFTNDEPNFFFNIDDRQVLAGTGMRTGADGIALSGDESRLYWTNLTGNHLYELPTALLRDFETSETVIENAVDVAAVLPSNTDGMISDGAGNIYMTALSLDGIMRYEEATGQVTRFAHHPEMNWPDTLSWGPEGELYVVSNHLHMWVDNAMDFENPEIPNFRIWRIEKPAGADAAN